MRLFTHRNRILQLYLPRRRKYRENEDFIAESRRIRRTKASKCPKNSKKTHFLHFLVCPFELSTFHFSRTSPIPPNLPKSPNSRVHPATTVPFQPSIHSYVLPYCFYHILFLRVAFRRSSRFPRRFFFPNSSDAARRL